VHCDIPGGAFRCAIFSYLLAAAHDEEKLSNALGENSHSELAPFPLFRRDGMMLRNAMLEGALICREAAVMCRD
jgi:hypothetical protein